MTPQEEFQAWADFLAHPDSHVTVGRATFAIGAVAVGERIFNAGDGKVMLSR